MTAIPQYDIVAYGENGLLARFSGAEDPVALALFTNMAAAHLRGAKGFLDVLAGLDSVAARFSPHYMTDQVARAALETAINKAALGRNRCVGKKVAIPVRYGGDHGPDFENLCKRNNLSPAELIETHASQTYTVMTVGFAPGFAYLGPLNEKLAAPRLSTPRAHVAKGSVGVAGSFTGIYPLPSPGGWRIIGRTPIELFDADSKAPFVLTVGDTVRFTPIGQDEFDANKGTPS